MHKPALMLSAALAVVMGVPYLPPSLAQVVNVGSSVNLNGEVSGQLINVGQDVSGEGCHIEGLLNAGGSVTLTDCHPVGGIRAGRQVRLQASEVLEDLVAGQGAWLDHATVRGNVTSPSASLLHSTIQGTLHTSDHNLVLDASEVGGIRIQAASQTVLGNSSVIGNGNVIVNGAGAMVSVSENGTVKANGYSIEGRPGMTLLITPDGDVYTNGRKSSGRGPDRYETYRRQHPGAPLVNGPGWAPGESDDAASGEAGPQMVIELKNGSVVHGNVEFQNGRGVVVVSPDSQLLGTVKGGSVQRR